MRKTASFSILVISIIVVIFSCGFFNTGDDGDNDDDDDPIGNYDTISPAVITDLTASNSTNTSLLISWTAPGDDIVSGKAASYDIRYSISNIDDTNWDSAIQVLNEPEPQLAGTLQTIIITNLSADTVYYFAIKTSDEVPNVSGLSNIADLKTEKNFSNVYVDPNQKNVTKGESFDLRIMIDPMGIEISGAQSDLTFDPGIIQINSITEGNLFSQEGNSTFFFISNGIDNTSGTAESIVCVILGPHNVQTLGSFFIINATAKEYGISRVALDNVIISDQNGISVPLKVINGNVNVTD